jgi:hypothetical protein
MDSQKVNIPVIAGQQKQFHASWLIEFMGLLRHLIPRNNQFDDFLQTQRGWDIDGLTKI